MKSMTVVTAGLLTSMMSFNLLGFDDFELGKLDMSKWRTEQHNNADEQLREVINTGGSSYLLFEERFTGGYDNNNARTNLFFNDPLSINSISVPVYIEAIESEGSATTRFRLFFDHLRINDDDPGGRLEVMLDLEKSAGQPMQARYYIGRCEDDACSTVEDAVFETGFTPVSLNTWHTLGISWTPSSITFSVDGVDHTIPAPAGAFLSTFPADQSWVFLGSRFRQLNSTHDSGHLRARVGEIQVNGLPYENYSLGKLDESRWLNPEAFKRIVEDGTLNMRLEVNNNTQQRINQIIIRDNPQSVSSLAADIRVDSASYTGNLQPRARLAGNWYNTGLAGPGEVGDMYADVLLYVDGNDLKGRTLVYHCTDQICNDGEILHMDNQLGPFSFGETYRASVAWTGEAFTFQLGGHSRSYTPTGAYQPAGDAKRPYKGIGLRMPGASGTGNIEASFDNVAIDAQGYTVFSNDEQLVFVPSKHRSGEVDLITQPGEQLTLSHFDPDRSILDFSVLLSSLHQQNALQNVRFDATPTGDDLVLRIQRTSPQETLAEVILEGQAGLDPNAIQINFSARPFSDWYFSALKALVGEAHLADYLKGFELSSQGVISHAYDFGNEINIAVKGRVVATEGEFDSLMNQEVVGEYQFDIDLSKGIDEYSQYPNSIFDPRYTLRTNEGLGFGMFNRPEFPEDFDGVTVSYEPYFSWIDEFDNADPADIADMEEWQNFASYMLYPKGTEMVPGPYALLEFNAFTTFGEIDPDTGESTLVENGVEVMLFSATDPANPFESWLDWFPAEADFVLLTGDKLGAAIDGEEQVLGKFFAKVEEVTLTSGSFSVNFPVETLPGATRRGLPVWLPALLMEQ